MRVGLSVFVCNCLFVYVCLCLYGRGRVGVSESEREEGERERTLVNHNCKLFLRNNNIPHSFSTNNKGNISWW